MAKWLAAALLALVAASPAEAQMKGLSAANVAELARTRTLDLRVMQQAGFTRPPLLADGMVARQGLAPNAYVGIGLARMYGRKKRGDQKITDQPSKRKPAVTFVLKF